jgi:hypothetical protein
MASRPFFLEDSVTLQLDRQYNKSLRPSQTNDWIFLAGSAWVGRPLSPQAASPARLACLDEDQ